MGGRAALRWLRALTLASVMLGAAYSGHLAGGGTAPPSGLLGPVLVVLTLAVAPFLDAPATAWRVVVLVLTGQALLHGALELVGSAAPMAHSPTGPGMAYMVPRGSSASSATSWVTLLTVDHVDMLAAHVGAALLVALWLAAGERAAWTLVGVTALTVAETWSALCDACVVTASVVRTRPPAPFALVDRPQVLPSVWEGCCAVSRRGPPRVCAAA